MTDWPVGNGEMVGRVRAFDWSTTSLGPVAGWPQSLRTAADVVLASPLGMIVLWGPDLVQLYNDAYRTVMGSKHPVGLGQPTRECWPEVWSFNAPIYEAVLRGEARSFLGQKLAIDRHGASEEAWFDLSYSLIRDEQGAVPGVLVTVVETTEQHRAVAALRGSEGRFRAFVTATSDVVYRMSPDWDVMRELDGVGFLADTRDASRGWLMNYIPEDERARVTTEIEASIRGRAVFELEHKVVRADGTVGWTLSRAVPLLDEAGEVTDWIGSAKDITEYKRAKVVLYESEARQAFLLKLSDTVRILVGSADIQGETTRLLREQLNAGWCYYVEWNLDRKIGLVLRDSASDGLPSLAGTHDVSDASEFLELLSDGAVRVVRDYANYEELPARIRQKFVGLGFRSMMMAPLVKEGRLIATMIVGDTEVRNWSASEASFLVEAAERTWAAVERARAEGALQESEERFSQFAASSSDALWIRDAATLEMEYVSPAIETIYGVRPESLLDGPHHWTALILPEDRETALAHLEEAKAGEAVVHEFRIRRPDDGSLRWIRNTDFPLRDAGGRVQRIGGIAKDVTDLKVTEAALADAEHRQRLLLEGMPQLVWRSADDGLWTWSSPQWQAYTGQTLGESLGWGWLDVVHPDDREATVRAWDEAKPHGRLDVEYRVRRAGDGAWRWHATRSVPVRAPPASDGAEGRVLEWLGTTTDIEDLKHLQAQQGVLVAELQHRTRNLIAVVRSIAEDTMEHTGPTEAFRVAFADRLSALSRVQGLLSRSEAEPITIGALVRLELDALGAGASGDRLTVAGPEVFLRPSSVQTLTLALHELATNARKYGALSHDRGHLTVAWREVIEGGERRLALDWIEAGLDQAPDRLASAMTSRGYGRELIEQALPHALGAHTTYALTEAGVRCTIDIPIRPSAINGGQL